MASSRHQRECCPLFTEAYYSGGSFVRGFSLPRHRRRGAKAEACYGFDVPARGRGGERTIGRLLVLQHCPFCGAPPKAGPVPEGMKSPKHRVVSEDGSNLVTIYEPEVGSVQPLRR